MVGGLDGTELFLSCGLLRWWTGEGDYSDTPLRYRYGVCRYDFVHDG